MITAIVFISAEVSRIPEVAEEIAALDGVSEVYSVTGEIDLIAIIRVRRHDDVIPIPGTSSIRRLEENVAALDVRLTVEDLDRIEQAAPAGAAAGERYTPEMLELTGR